ncbi:MAG: LysM peptidoglycan-binding domain-containing protein [Deltaproteobacteria bacterium]|nr:LysM peptidoglycan-binding domain-containing protein [Deltaproteobacteria bacterium]
MILAVLLAGIVNAADVHVVHTGDTLESIAAELGLPEWSSEIALLNNLDRSAPLLPGTVLLLPPHPDSLEQAAEVLSAVGAVYLMPASGPRVPVATATRLAAGSTICTGPGAYATLRLARSRVGFDHDDVVLLEGTCLTLVSASARPEGRTSLLDVASGTVAVERGGVRPGTVAVRTGSGLTAGDAGGFRVSIEPDAARTEAWAAPVSVFGAGQEVRLDAGTGSRTRRGETPEDPVRLPPATALVSPGDGEALLRPDFVWQPVDTALGYRVELSTDRFFTQIKAIEEVPDPAWRPDLLFLPYRVREYWWRVSAFDRVGFVGTPSDPRRLSLPAGIGP